MLSYPSLSRSCRMRGSDKLEIAGIAAFWTAIIIAGIMFWWPLFAYSWHYWAG